MTHFIALRDADPGLHVVLMGATPPFLMEVAFLSLQYGQLPVQSPTEIVETDR